MQKKHNGQAVFNAFTAMTSKQKMLISRTASVQCRGTMYSQAEDLMHEALARMADGDRVWPIEVPFPIFFTNAIRSVASADRQRVETRLSVSWESVCEAQMEIQTQTTPSAEAAYSQFEQMQLLANDVATVRCDLRHDTLATQILDGLIAGTKRSTLRDSLGVSARDFANARERVMRRLIATRFPEQPVKATCKTSPPASRASMPKRKGPK